MLWVCGIGAGHNDAWRAAKAFDRTSATKLLPLSLSRVMSSLSTYWLLQQRAGIDAVLIFKFADHCANIKYDVPTERMPRADYLSGIVNGASDDFRLGYLNEIWNLLGLPQDGSVNSVSEIRIPLYPIFSGEFPNGYAAGARFNFICELLDKIPGIVEFGSPQHLQLSSVSAYETDWAG